MFKNIKSRSKTKKLGLAMLIISWIIGIALIWMLSNQLIFNPKPLKITKLGNQTTIEIYKNLDGHYNITALINNYKVKFLIDTGASQVSISEKLASKLNLKKLYKIQVGTASGKATAYTTKIDSLVIGQIAFNNISCIIMPNMPSDFALLGMNVLKHFEMKQKDNTLTLTIKANNSA